MFSVGDTIDITFDTVEGKLVFSLPGSSNAVKLAIEQLILPEIIHLVRQLKGLH